MASSQPRYGLHVGESLDTLRFSVSSFLKAVHSPYVRAKLKMYVKPIAVATVCVYVLGSLAYLPLIIVARLLQLLTLGALSAGGVRTVGRRWLYEAVSYVPIVAMLYLRYVMRKPLFKVFIHTLRDVNPDIAKTIESSPAIHHDTGAPRASFRQHIRRLVDKFMQLLVLELFLFVVRQVPYLGALANAAVHYVTMKGVLGDVCAALLSALALIPFLEIWVRRLVQVWRLTNYLGIEMLSDYISHFIPHSERPGFYRQYGLRIALFLAPQMALMQLPIIGPLMYIPIQASTAYLVDWLAKQSGVQSSPPAQSHQEVQKGSSPTLPTGPMPEMQGMKASQGGQKYLFDAYPEQESERPDAYAGAMSAPAKEM